MLSPQPLITPVISLLRCIHQTPKSTPLDASLLKRAFHEAFASMTECGPELGWREVDVHEAAYALVALSDETIIERGGALSAQWMREQLQLTFFGQATLGEGFFQRLEALRREPDRGHVLLVYWLAMELGFRGAYALRGERALRELREAVRRDLEGQGLLEPRALAPDVAAPPEAPKRKGPERFLLAFGVGTLLLALFLDAAFFADLSLRESALRHATSSMLGR
jgi:type VI secretion system protein ImpK